VTAHAPSTGGTPTRSPGDRITPIAALPRARTRSEQLAVLRARRESVTGLVPPMRDGRATRTAAAGPVSVSRPRDRTGATRSRHRLVVVLLDAGRPMTVAELADAVDLPAKSVSDLLRAACRRGHVRRVDRGTYQAGRVPRSSESVMRHQTGSADGTFAYK
jgi:hypothetical protein